MGSSKTYAMLMAGGAGTRFWPASRKRRPKQLLALTGSAPLLRQTAERLVPLCGWEHIWVSTGAHLVDATLEVLPELGREQMLVEPVGRNTAPCIGWAAATIARDDPEAVVMALPADPHIGDERTYRDALSKAIASARTGLITTIGVRPTHPETGYGYIEAGEPSALSGVLRVRRFVEKPDRAKAEELVAQGNYFWNAGMFFFRACDMLAAIRAHMPELGAGLAELDAAAAAGREAERLAEVFPRLPAVSIDYGVMEHMTELGVVPASFDWSDVGSWLAAAELAPKDADGNSAPAHAVLIDAAGNHVVDLRSGADEAGTARVIALVGVRDLVVVETDDALLVVPQERSQQVREVVRVLKGRGEEGLV